MLELNEIIKNLSLIDVANFKLLLGIALSIIAGIGAVILIRIADRPPTIKGILIGFVSLIVACIAMVYSILGTFDDPFTRQRPIATYNLSSNDVKTYSFADYEEILDYYTTVNNEYSRVKGGDDQIKDNLIKKLNDPYIIIDETQGKIRLNPNKIKKPNEILDNDKKLLKNLN